MIGIGLVAVTLFFGFTGYSLLYEQLSYWGITVAGNLNEAVPLIGDQLARLLRGGETIGDNTLTRFFILHIGILASINGHKRAVRPMRPMVNTAICSPVS